MLESKLKLGAFEYYHFASFFTVNDRRQSSSYGSHLNRKMAALKCAAEAVERMAMVDYFTSNPNGIPKSS